MFTHFQRELRIIEENFNFRYLITLLEILLTVMYLKYEIRINFSNDLHKNCKNANKILGKLYSVIFLAYNIGNSMEFFSSFDPVFFGNCVLVMENLISINSFHNIIIANLLRYERNFEILDLHSSVQS